MDVKNDVWVVAGLGKSGQSVARFLAAREATVKAWDTREKITIPDDIEMDVTLGKTLPQNYWDGVTKLVLSPGLSPEKSEVQRAASAGVEIIGDVELYARFSHPKAFGITGSNGKTTVTLLLTHILTEMGFQATAAGNIGEPVLTTLDDDYDYVVLELSSFQLETTHSLKLAGATILNISDDHLDRHGTMANYQIAKQRIYDNADVAIWWREQEETKPTNASLVNLSIGLDKAIEGFGYDEVTRQVTFNGVSVLDMRRCQLLGLHNVLNIQAALALASLAGIEPQNAAEAVYRFTGAAHRCTEIGEYQGVRFIDDSKATNVGATTAALDGITDSVDGKIILIAGGDAKGADLSALQPVFEEHVGLLIGLGKDGEKLCALAPHSQYHGSMEEAVQAAIANADSGDVVLLSPACASLDMFKDYQHRAKVFADAVLQTVGE